MVSMQHPDAGPRRGGPGGPGGPSLVPCPECDLPAEIADHFWLQSTDGPVLHVCVVCVGGHYFRMPADGLAAGWLPARAEDSPRTCQPGVAAAGPDGLSARAAGVGFSRLPGRLGTVGTPLPDEVRDEAANASLA